MRSAYAEALPALGRDVTDEQALPAYLEGWALSRWVFWTKLKHVVRLAQLRPNSRVFDFGCGSGILLPRLSDGGRRVYAADLHTEMARSLAGQLGLTRVEFVPVADWRTVVPDGAMDAIIAANVLEHVENRQEILADLRRKLAPAGRLVISGPTENALYRFGRSLIRFSGHYHVTNVHHVLADARAVGLREVAIRRWPLPGPFCLYQIAAFVRGASEPDRSGRRT